MDGETVVALRRVRPISIDGVEPKRAAVPDPVLEWVDPSTLLIDDSYQRTLAAKSINLIRRIVGDFDWRRYKPPIVARTSEGLKVIDGQHTAIAAVSHPQVFDIPVLIVEVGEQADQASAYLGHNRDRVAMTPQQMHVAAVVAGDPEAIVVSRICEEIGIRILKNPPSNGAYKPRDCMAVGAVSTLVKRRGADRARVALKICAEAEWAPVTAGLVKAVDCLLTEKEYEGIEPDRILGALLQLGQKTAERDAGLFAASHDVPAWRGLAVVLFRKGRHGRRG